MQQRCSAVRLSAFVILVVALSLPAVTGAHADPQAERAAIRGQRAELAVQIDTMSADTAQIDSALAALDANVQGQESLLANAQRAHEDASRRAAEAESQAAARAGEVDRLGHELSMVAVDSYVNPPGQELLDRLKASTATESAKKHALLGVQANRTGDVVDQLRATKYQLEREREAAEEARSEAERQQREATERLGELAEARTQQQQFAAGLEERLNAKLAEAQVLAEFDSELAAQMMAEQEELAAKIRSIPAPPDTNVPSDGSPADGGSLSPAPPDDPGSPAPPDDPGSPPPTTPPPTTPPPVTPPPPAPGLTWVRGIQVASSLAGQLEAMLAKASSEGFVFGGYGYRDTNMQIALRRQNCGTSEYAIYQMSPSQCSPPTAIPGSSMHERGLAIDFRWNGSSISTRDNPAFRWLAANAAAFGLCNLPSEPWHWSTSCR